MRALVHAAAMFLLLACLGLGGAQAEASAPIEPLLLVATPQVADPVFGQTVLLTAPLKQGARIGVILNRPTEHSMKALFPDHHALAHVEDTVYYGGPMLPEVIVALVQVDEDPGRGALKVGPGLFLAMSAPLIEKALGERPQSVRCFVGSVIWQAGELDDQIKDGVWVVVPSDAEMIFSRHPESLWEVMQDKSRQMTAGRRDGVAATVALAPAMAAH